MRIRSFVRKLQPLQEQDEFESVAYSSRSFVCWLQDVTAFCISKITITTITTTTAIPRCRYHRIQLNTSNTCKFSENKRRRRGLRRSGVGKSKECPHLCCMRCNKPQTNAPLLMAKHLLEQRSTCTRSLIDAAVLLFFSNLSQYTNLQLNDRLTTYQTWCSKA